jgi:hypothetical protein
MLNAEFDLYSNRPTTRSLTNMQKQLLKPAAPAKHPMVVRATLHKTPLSSKRGGKKVSGRNSYKASPHAPNTKSTGRQLSRPVKSPRSSMVRANLGNSKAQLGSQQVKPAKMIYKIPRGGSQAGKRQPYSRPRAASTISIITLSAKDDLGVKEEEASSAGSEENSTPAEDKTSPSCFKPNRRVLRSNKRQDDRHALPTFRCEDDESSSTDSSQPRNHRSARNYRGYSSRGAGPRGKYRSYSKEDKERAISIAVRENSYNKAAEITKISPKNIKRWVVSGTARQKGRI